MKAQKHLYKKSCISNNICTREYLNYKGYFHFDLFNFKPVFWMLTRMTYRTVTFKDAA